MPSPPGTTGERGSTPTRADEAPVKVVGSPHATPNTRGPVMQVGDLVKYHPKECNNQVAGLVVGFEPIESNDDYLHVQWFDWTPGDIAVECGVCLVVVSSANENR